MEVCRRHLPHRLRHRHAMIFVLIEWKVARYPLLPLRLFASISNAAGLIACFIHGAVFVTGTSYIPL